MLDTNEGKNKVYRLTKEKERKMRDLSYVRYVEG